MSTPGERIEQERLRRNLSREELSDEMDRRVSSKTIQRIEEGTRPNSRLRFLVEEHLGIAPTETADDEDDVDKDVILRSMTDIELASELLRRALLRAGDGDTPSSRVQPKRGQRGVAPRNLTQSDSPNQATPDK